MHVTVEIADAVTAELNAAVSAIPQPFGGVSFAAARHYLPVFTRDAMKTLHVSVVPKGLEEERLDRTTTQVEVQVDIAVQQQVDPADLDDVDALMLLVQQIGDYLRMRKLTELAGAAWLRNTTSPIYSIDHLEKLRQFTAVLTVTYRVAR